MRRYKTMKSSLREGIEPKTKIMADGDMYVAVHRWGEDGEGEYVNHFALPVERKLFDSAQELVSYLDDKCLYWGVDKVSDWDYFDGFLSTSCIVDADNEKDEDGDYIDNASVRILLVSEPREPSEEEARWMGFEA